MLVCAQQRRATVTGLHLLMGIEIECSVVVVVIEHRQKNSMSCRLIWQMAKYWTRRFPHTGGVSNHTGRVLTRITLTELEGIHYMWYFAKRHFGNLCNTDYAWAVSAKQRVKGQQRKNQSCATKRKTMPVTRVSILLTALKLMLLKIII